MNIWVARDKDGALWGHNGKPNKITTFWTSDCLPSHVDEFPGSDRIKWEDAEPTRVEATYRVVEGEK